MSETIKNRSEILFIYDIRDGNPNGDPMDENKPRIDEETGINIVTDVRLKRTIRDYLHNFKGQEIFVREIIYDKQNGYIQDGKKRAKDFEDKAERILERMHRYPSLRRSNPPKRRLDNLHRPGAVQDGSDRSIVLP